MKCMCEKDKERKVRRENDRSESERKKERKREKDNKSMLNRSLPIYNFERHIFVIRHFSA